MSPTERSNVLLLTDQFLKLLERREEVPYEPIVTDPNDPNHGVTLHEVAVFGAHNRLRAALEAGGAETMPMGLALADVASAIGLRQEVAVGCDQTKPFELGQTWPALREGVKQPDVVVVPVLDADGNQAKNADGSLAWEPHPDLPPADNAVLTYVISAKAASGLYWLAMERPETKKPVTISPPLAEHQAATASRIAGLKAHRDRLAALVKQEQEAAAKEAATAESVPKMVSDALIVASAPEAPSIIGPAPGDHQTATARPSQEPPRTQRRKPRKQKVTAGSSAPHEELTDALTDDDRAVALFHRWMKEGRKYQTTSFAQTLRVPRTQLYAKKRFPNFQKLLEAHKATLPNGDRNKSGDVEAWREN
jgi:hypothetical protein